MDVAPHGTMACVTVSHAPPSGKIAVHSPLPFMHRRCVRPASESNRSLRKALGDMRWNGLVYRKRHRRELVSRSHFLSCARKVCVANAPVLGSGSLTNTLGSSLPSSSAMAKGLKRGPPRGRDRRSARSANGRASLEEVFRQNAPTKKSPLLT